ncbi:hypothetical protein N752_23350 [Desulforamulus aquiferis]|nr:aminotransferase class I/II-fold pyridoxal phosphate-dependent enzyme [Desulforamulus aquiferis]RYD02719.1 hypothetical protein N752_23350 [Desulforamulus aquiferis]
MWLGYTEAPGNPELRHYISKLYRNISDSQVLVTAGAEEGIFIFMNSLLDKGDHVIVQYPCYQSLVEIACSIGCEITKWEMSEEQGWDLDMDFLASNIKANTKAIIINSPHNPTGYLIPREKLKHLMELANAQNILVFSDEVYRYLEYSPADGFEAACDIYENAISLGVMSKSYGLAGLRIGWVATKNRDVLKKMSAFKDYTSICNSAPSEFLSIVAIKHHDKLIQRNLDIINNNLKALDIFFASYSDYFNWLKPKAGPIAFPSLNCNINAEEFCHSLVHSKGVLLLPGIHYDDKCSKNFRIGFGRQNMTECLAKLDEYMQEIIVK